MLNNKINVNTNKHISENPINKPKVKTEIPIHVIDPTRVTKTPANDSGQQLNQELFNYNPDSVFDKFIKSLQNSPLLSEATKKLLLSKQFINSNIKNDPVLSTFFESFLENIKMNDYEMLDFLKFQQASYTKFQGDFFDKLRSLLKANPNNQDFKMILKNFLRSYDSFSSVGETNKSIQAALKNIENNLPEVLKKTFKEISGNLSYDRKSMDSDLNVLKNDILPFMGRYISKMNDFGPVRDYVSVLVHNLIRLEFASASNFSDEMENLFEYLKYNFDIGEIEIELLKMSLINTAKGSSLKNDSIESFLMLLKKGSMESENPVNRGLMKDMADSLLFSHNVNIPLIHLFLPLNYNGMFMFSEIWIGREEDSSDKKTNFPTEQTYKAFITFDIQNIGYFETTLKLKESRLSLDLYVPNNLSNHIEKIKNDLNTLLNKNGIIMENINVQECIKARRFNEVFTNLTERKNSVDVTI